MSEQVKEYSTDNKPQRATKQGISYIYQNTRWGRWFNNIFSAFVLFVANGLFDKPITAIFTTIIFITGIILIYNGKKHRNEITQKIYVGELSFFIIAFLGLGVHLYTKAVNEETQLQRLINENIKIKHENDSLKESNNNLKVYSETTKARANLKSELGEKYFEAGNAPSIIVETYPLELIINDKIRWKFNLKNSGKTKAKKIIISPRSCWDTSGTLNTFYLDKNVNIPSSDLHPDEDKDFSYSAKDIITPEFHKMIMERKTFLYVYCKINYQDTFSRKDSTNVCWIYLSPNGVSEIANPIFLYEE